MSPAAAANWPMARMAGHPRIAFRRRHSMASPYSSRPRYRNSRSTLSVRAGFAQTWAGPTPLAQSQKALQGWCGSPPPLLKIRTANFLETAKSFLGDFATSYFVLLNESDWFEV